MDRESSTKKIKKAEADYLERKLEVTEAKIRFLQAANEFSPLNVIERRPYASLGLAFLAGFGLTMIGAGKSAAPLIGTAAQISGLASQLIPLFTSRARSSGG